MFSECSLSVPFDDYNDYNDDNDGDDGDDGDDGNGGNESSLMTLTCAGGNVVIAMMAMKAIS